MLYLIDELPFHKIVPLLFLFIYCLTVLTYQKTWSLAEYSIQIDWKPILLRFLVISLLLLLSLIITGTSIIYPSLADRPFLIRMVLLYPFLSAFPQEVIYRKFFYHRYGNLVKNKKIILVLNILLFSFAHIYFKNVIVLIGTILGGYIFNLTYLKRRSLLAVSIEHSFYGLVLLSSGLSDYFNKPF